MSAEGLMKKIWLTATLVSCGVFLAILLPAEAKSHGGGTDANGCHMDRKAGTRHCHGGKRSQAQTLRSPPSSSAKSSRSTYYANCSEARAAGAAPVRRGDPGYASHLDRDNDGIGCE